MSNTTIAILGFLVGMACTALAVVAGHMLRSSTLDHEPNSTPAMLAFEREKRYYVFKVRDIAPETQPLLDRLEHSVNTRRRREGRLLLRTCVIESDWPEYEPTWNALARRVLNQQEQAP